MKNIILILSLIYGLNAFAVGKIQNEDVKSLAQLQAAGGIISQLINDTKIYDTTNNQQLSDTISQGIGSGGGGGGTNLLKGPDNSGFEQGTTGWTVSNPGTLTIETVSPLFGAKSGKFLATGTSQTLSSNAKSIDVGLQGANCLAAISYKYAGTSGDYSLQVFDGTNILVSTSLDQSTTTSTAYAGFQCPSAGTIRVRLISNVASPGTITVDGPSQTGGLIQLGSNILLAQIAQAQFIGNAYIAGTAGCDFTTTSSSFVAYSSTPACPGVTVEMNPGPGIIQTTDTDLPRFTLNGLTQGDYRVQMSFVGTGATATSFECYTISDGSSLSGRNCVTDNVANHPVVIEGFFHYTSPGNKTFEIYGASSSGTNLLLNHTANGRIQMSVIKLPTFPQTVVQGIDTTGWYVDANISTTDSSNIDLGTGAQSSYVGMSNANMEINSNTGSIGVQIPCSGTNPSTGSTCSAGNEMAGVVFDLPKAGSVMACASFTVSLYSGQTIFQIVETPNNAQTILQEGHTKIGGTTSDIGFRNCGVFTFNSIGQKTLRLMYEQPALPGNPLVYVDLDPARGQRDMHWEIYPINQQIPMPYLAKQLQNPSSSIMQHATAYITNSGTPTITRQDGSFISSLTDNGAGDVSVNFSASTWTSVPNCSCGGVEESADASAVSCSVSKSTSPSASTYRFKTRLGGTLTDRDFTISCTGPKQ